MSSERAQKIDASHDYAPRKDALNPLGIDTILFDYGGVVGTHRVQPYWNQMAALLDADPKIANTYLLETSPHGIAYRLGDISMDQFWNEVQRLAGI